MNWTIPQISGQSLQVSLENNNRLFIVGANGSGKSALIQHLVSSNQDEKVRRISAHRQTWFQSGNLDLTPLSRKQFDGENTNIERQDQARWRDDYAQQKQSAILFDLVAKENARARSITHHVDSGNTGEAEKTSAESRSPFAQLNELLRIGTLAVTLENYKDEEILAHHRDGSAPFSIAQMSDGERNAAILAAAVLTVEPGTVLLIDEPERHLHRSIIEPLLSALFEKRTDCTFVVSTHEVALPVADPEARVLMVRSCKWEDDKATAWDVELLEPNSSLPEGLKRSILGSRKRILFVEGDSNSLDLPLYSVLFPDISVVSKGGCSDVQKAVRGLRESQQFHRVEAFGLIDRDSLEEEDVKRLVEGWVFALDMCSVESLYYCSDSIAAVARWQEKALRSKADDMIKLANQKALEALNKGDMAERMAARRCERRVRDSIVQKIPDWKCIEAKSKFDISVDIPYQKELDRFNKLVNEKRLDDLVARYPLRESRAFEAIVKALKLESKKIYQRMLVSRIRDDNKLAQSLKQRVGPLSNAL